MSSTARENYRIKRGKKAKGPPFVALHHYMVDSEAWHRLSFTARCAYVELARLYNGINNGELALSTRLLAERMPCSKNTAGKALDQLEQAGFIEVAKVGAFRRKERHASEYRLTCYQCDVSGKLPSKRFDPGKPWIARPKRRDPRAQFLTKQVPNFGADKSSTPPSVPKSDPDKPVPALVSVPNTGTHIDIYHEGVPAVGQDKPRTSTLLRASPSLSEIVGRKKRTRGAA